MKHIIYTAVICLCITGCSKDANKTTQKPTDYNVNSITDVQYGQNTNYEKATQKLLLDIYSPKNASATQKYPLVVMAHSGSFLEGDKKGLADLCQSIASHGYIAVSIDYRIGWDYGNAQAPTACSGDTTSLERAVYRSLQDYNAALRFLVHNAGKYFIDTSNIFVGGSSAGAVAAVNTVYVTPEFIADSYYNPIRQELGGLKNSDNDLTDTFTIKGDIVLWGAVITPVLITPATAIPMIAFHGSEDQTIPIDEDHYTLCPNYPVLYGSRYMYNLLTSYGVPAVLHIADGQGHGPDMYQADPDFVSANIDCFLQGLMGKTTKTGTFNNLASSCQ